ncbi:class I SAM-dependent methyltransferase [Catenuloplanes atrovinosus]|uniref:Trans-aconitate methyltransferase n=1 Tax=Catenuloplanes atrovinosus TaxID=137266 RepID=A0AAE3YP94_9ACTN|nr:class I SAM-dependent methyltransferase [Catenuloplanes atrovinosus]MDR7277429.1 trans-aconitate methyltransferase [Catenuloplanes atrovinosus]
MRDLLTAWDRQQEAYIAHREQRFTVMLEVLELVHGDEFTVLDLACGPGAISDRVLAAFPKARVVAVDHDPILLTVARGALAERHGTDRITIADADLAAPGWERALPTGIDAVLSSTALHWLSPTELSAVYATAATLLRPGGVLLNADHLRYGASHPTLRDVAERHDARTQAAAFAAGTLDYQQWYAEAARRPELAALTAERAARFADRPPQPLAPLAFHLAALEAAGFAETGTVWQYLDDFVVFARR